MKKRWMTVMTLTMSITAASVVWAGAFDQYVDYQNPDGTYSYYFEQGVLVTLDENWYRNTFVKTGDRGATFYQRASYDAYTQEGLEGGGRLFTIGASVNTDFSELPSFEYIGFDEDSCMNYYAELPSDYQAYMGDETIRAEYDALWAEVKDVIAGIRIGDEIQAENNTVHDDGNVPGDKLISADSVDLNAFLTGGLGQDQGTQTLAEGEHQITLDGDVFIDCPSSAKAGEIVTVYTWDMADGRVVVEMNGVEIGMTGSGVFTFPMPDEDVVLRGYTSTAGFSGA